MSFNYEYFNKNSILSYPGKNSQSIFLHSLDGDNHGEENFYSLIVEKRISSSNKINEDSIDEDSEEKDFSIIFKESIFPAYLNNEESINYLDNSFKNTSDRISRNKALSGRSSNNKGNNESLKFRAFSLQKKGRKTEKPIEKLHDSSADDNCLRKIQNHFFKFIINLTNEVLTKENIEEDFKPIDYKIKSNVNHDFFCELQKKSIKNILEMNISPKYKSKSKDINREVLNKINSYSNWLNDFFNINYLDLFSEYYNNEKPLLKFVFKKKEIELSKTKSFYYLLNNKNNQDKKKEKDLSNIAKRFFIVNNSRDNKILFQTKETIDLKE